MQKQFLIRYLSCCQSNNTEYVSSLTKNVKDNKKNISKIVSG